MSSEHSSSSCVSRALNFDDEAQAEHAHSQAEEAESQDRSGTVINTPVPSRFISYRRTRRYTFRSRRPASPEEPSELRSRRLSNAERPENPFEEQRHCCKKHRCFQHVDKTHAFHWYREIMAMDRAAVKQTLLSWYHSGHGKFTFDGKPVCWRFLNQAFEFSNDLLSAVRNSEHARATQAAFAQPRRIRRATLRDSIIIFLRITSKSLGDDIPHRNFSNLPMANKSQAYQAYVTWFNAHGPLRFTRSPPSLATFYSVWKAFVPDVKLMRNIGFEKCAECVFYAEERASYILNPVKLLEIKAASKQHYDSVAAERRGYELRKMQASRGPQHYLSLAVDGADQSSYGLPHFLQKSKGDRGHKIAVKLVGIIMHGVENGLFLFSMAESFETGANHIIESVHPALERKKQKIRKLAPSLFVQADNCTRENKNRFFLGYLEMLVARRVFVEVQLSCLEVGHTYTDVDQSFSCVHRRLDNHAAFTLTQFEDELRKCYSPTPYVEELSRIANFSEQCERSNVLTNASRYTVYRYFRLIRSSNQAERGLYRTKSSVKRHLADAWVELPGACGGGFLKSPPDLLNFPCTKTRALPNVREVNLCLRAAEARVRDAEIMQELYDLRDRIYTPQEYEGHWKSDCFELNGDYSPDAERINMAENTEVNESEEIESDSRTNSGRLRYKLGDFVAVRPESRYRTPFWIAEVVGFGEVDDEGEMTIE